MRVIELAGSHYDMGRQHSWQVRDLRSRVEGIMLQRLEALKPYQSDLKPHVSDLASAWEEAGRPTLEMMRGIADGLELKWGPFFRYTIASYLEDRIQHSIHGEGCTVWAASASVTRQGAPILAKNRDYMPNHQPLQCLARVKPSQGYRYLYATSAGSPAVFSSGINEAALAVADTHVTSCDIGPGVARYSVMMEILEHHNSVASALDYLRHVTHVGDGTLTLIDQDGIMAVFEAGHSSHSVIRPEDGFVVSTNHFRGEQLRGCWIDRDPAELRGNSQNRHARLAAALRAGGGRVDTRWAQRLMADHGGSRPTAADQRRYAICRHAEIDVRSSTISTALYEPRERRLVFADGQPCRAPFQAWPVVSR